MWDEHEGKAAAAAAGGASGGGDGASLDKLLASEVADLKDPKQQRFEIINLNQKALTPQTLHCDILAHISASLWWVSIGTTFPKSTTNCNCNSTLSAVSDVPPEEDPRGRTRHQRPRRGRPAQGGEDAGEPREVRRCGAESPLNSHLPFNPL